MSLFPLWEIQEIQMKLLGDVPLEHKLLAAELEEWEATVVSNAKLPPDQAAKFFTCLAHDWYAMGCEEEGNRLLEASEKVCPGYFRGIMLQQTLEDSSFDYLVKRLSSLLAWTLVSRLADGG